MSSSARGSPGTIRFALKTMNGRKLSAVTPMRLSKTPRRSMRRKSLVSPALAPMLTHETFATQVIHSHRFWRLAIDLHARIERLQRIAREAQHQWPDDVGNGGKNPQQRIPHHAYLRI